MREIKFRVWFKEWDGEDIGKMFRQVVPIDCNFTEVRVAFDDDECYDGNFKVGEDVVLMQYTGLKDKNGVEIHEGDIVNLFDPRPQVEHKKKVSAVVFINGAFLVNTQMGALPDRTTLETLYCHLMWREYSDCEVIGNIYENPELLAEATS